MNRPREASQLGGLPARHQEHKGDGWLAMNSFERGRLIFQAVTRLLISKVTSWKLIFREVDLPGRHDKLIFREDDLPGRHASFPTGKMLIFREDDLPGRRRAGPFP